jgi:hypothetical protein
VREHDGLRLLQGFFERRDLLLFLLLRKCHRIKGGMSW